MKKRTFLLLSLLLSLALIACAAPGAAAPAPVKTEAPTEAPAQAADTENAPAQPDETAFTFSADTIDGKHVDETLFTGTRLTMVNIWGTFCGYCIDEMPELAELNRDYAGDSFQVIGIVGDVSEAGAISDAARAEVADIVSKAGADYVHLLPGDDVNALFLAGVYAYPTTFFVDSNGKLVGKPVLGAIGQEKFAQLIETYLAEVSVPGIGCPC